jgi:hypothetical protein
MCDHRHLFHQIFVSKTKKRTRFFNWLTQTIIFLCNRDYMCFINHFLWYFIFKCYNIWLKALPLGSTVKKFSC